MKVDGMKLRKERYRRELTQVQLREISGVNRRTISQIENGYSCVSLRTLNKLSAALDIAASELVS